MNYLDQIQKEGYIQIPFDPNHSKLLELEFDEWRNSFGFDLPRNHGIIQHYGIGQTSFLYKARNYTQSIFQSLFPSQPIVFSMDGACYYPPQVKNSNRNWLHRDLKPQDTSTVCFQGVLDLIPTQGGLTIQPYSHLIDTSSYSSDKNWWKIPKELQTTLKILQVDKPTLTLFDSRLFHMNTPSYRKALYISAQPLKNSSLSHSWKNKRLDHIQKGYTTSHWGNSNSKNSESKFRSISEPHSPVVLHSIRSSIVYQPTEEDLKLVGL